MIKKIFLISILIKIGFISLFSQSLFEYNPDVSPTTSPTEMKSAAAATRYIPNGGCFTPKGDLRVLIIFASFGGAYDQQNVDGWPSSSIFPNWVSASNKPFYTTEADFANSAADNNINSTSNFYYQMSNKTFRLFADYYPNRVIVDASSSSNWTDLNKKVIAQISGFNWAPYDRRINHPGYYNDYSGYNPDTKPDFIIICYRFAYNWQTYPNANMKTWCGGCNGFSSVGLSGASNNGYTFTSDGFTHVTGNTNPTAMFLHETGHSLYDAPHYNGNNSVAGDYFYYPKAGWGMMILNSLTSALGWERWILDWTPNIAASGVNGDIKSSADLPANGEFTLRDFITTGDMVRIKIPNGTSKNQYLWIENHQGKSAFDNNFYTPSFCGSPVPSPPRGIIAYVETVNDNKNSISNFTNGNGFRFLHANGNYDFSFDPTPLTPSLAYCGNITYNLHKGAANPIGGQNLGELIRQDFDNDGQILYNGYHYGSLDNSAKNEGTSVIVLDGYTSVDYFMGKYLAFSIGQKAGMAENPCITNTPTYSSSSAKMAPYYLNGISLKVISKDASGNIKIQIKFNDVGINKNTSWAATQITLPDITGNSSPDVNVLSNITLTIDKSGTPNRHTKSNFGDFINPTVLNCSQNSLFRMQANSKVDIINYSTLILESGSTFEINDGAVLSVKSGSTIKVSSGANLIVKGSGKIEVESGAYICLESGANINLQDYLSVINLRNGYQIGVNPNVSGLSGNCSSNPAAFTKTGNGSINTYNTNNYIQNQTFSVSDYQSGYNIYAGTNVTSSKPQGPVIINNNSIVIFDAAGDVILENGFEVQLGSDFEAK